MKRIYIKLLFFIFVLMYSILLSGCWNYRDLTDMSIVIGAGFDMSNNGDIEMTVQIVKPSNIKSSEGQAQSQNAVTNVNASGKTVFECIRNFTSKTNKRIYWGHLQIMVIGEEVAKNGIDDVVDLFERDQETRRRTDVIIAKNNKAKMIIEARSMLNNLPAVHIAESLQSYKANGKVQETNLLEVIQNLEEPQKGTIIGTIEDNSSAKDNDLEKMSIEGSAIFRGDVLEGYLDGLETRGFLFAENKIKSVIITIPNPNSEGEQVAIEIIRSKSESSVSFVNNIPTLKIKVDAQGSVGQEEGVGDLTTPEMTDTIEKLTEKEIKSEIEKTMNILQKKYKNDAYGFLDDIYKNHYKQWLNIKSDWTNIFSDAPTEVEVKVSMKRTGLIKQPAYGQ